MLIIDTNVVSEMMRPEPSRRVIGWLSRQTASDVHMTALTVAEISYGLETMPNGRRQRDLDARFRQVLESGFSGRILAFDAATGLVYGKIMAARRDEGRPMSVVDGQIAAIAKVNAAVLATRNVTDYVGCDIALVNPFED